MEYGKFNSAEELLKGYTELEKSFTQKCQQLSELRLKLEEKTESSANSTPIPQLPELRLKLEEKTESSTNSTPIPQLPELRTKLESSTVSSENSTVDSQPVELQKQSEQNTNNNPANNCGTSEQSPPQAGEKNGSAEANVTCAVPVDNDASSTASKGSTPKSAIEQIKQYLAAHPEERDLLLNKSNASNATLPRVIAGGGNVSMALPSRPKTIKEASLMAKELFKN